jgi:hypothetical protein
MSLAMAIDVDTVVAVLLPDGWHKVQEGSFRTGAYEFMGGEIMVGSGRVQGVPATGGRWLEADGSVVSCPLTSVLAVRQGKAKAKGQSNLQS